MNVEIERSGFSPAFCLLACRRDPTSYDKTEVEYGLHSYIHLSSQLSAGALKFFVGYAIMFHLLIYIYELHTNTHRWPQMESLKCVSYVLDHYNFQWDFGTNLSISAWEISIGTASSLMYSVQNHQNILAELKYHMYLVLCHKASQIPIKNQSKCTWNITSKGDPCEFSPISYALM